MWPYLKREDPVTVIIKANQRAGFNLRHRAIARLGDGCGFKAKQHCEPAEEDEIMNDGFIGSARFSMTCENAETEDEEYE